MQDDSDYNLLCRQFYEFPIAKVDALKINNISTYLPLKIELIELPIVNLDTIIILDPAVTH